MQVDPHKRYQRGLAVIHLYPKRTDKTCACGCGTPLPQRRRRWASQECQTKAVTHFLIIKGDTKTIRAELYKRDQGQCANCGHTYTRSETEADHITPVAHGGGGCDLSNFQTLCRECHKEKTRQQNTKEKS